MAKKVSYHTALRLQMSDLIEQLDLSDFYKQSLRERWLDQMIWADKKAGQNQKRHYRLRLTTIVGGVILPALVGISIQLGPTNPFARDWFPGLTFALSQIIAVSATIEEFCRYGDRWREYRQMAEDLKTEGWQYLQLTGPYQPNRPWGAEVEAQDPLPRSRSYDRERLVRPTIERRSGRDHATGNRHLESYPRFANRVESIIKNDVKSYMAGLAQQQAQQEARVEEILAQAQSAAQDRNLLNQTNPALALPPYPNAPGYAVPGYSSYPPGAVMPTYLSAPGYGAMPQMPTYPPASGYGVPQPNEAPGFAPAPSPAPPISEQSAPAPPLAAFVPTLAPMTSGATIAPVNSSSSGIQPFSPGPKATELNAAILTAALNLKGMSSAGGPDGGNNACAWALNQVLQKAGIPALGDNPLYMPSLHQALRAGRGQLMAQEQSKAGDLVVANGEAHIGIALEDGCKTVLSNSSSRAQFCWESSADFDGYYNGSSTIYRLLR